MWDEMSAPPSPGAAEPPCGVMFLWTPGDLESLKPCGFFEYRSVRNGKLTLLLAPSLKGVWLRCVFRTRPNADFGEAAILLRHDFGAGVFVTMHAAEAGQAWEFFVSAGMLEARTADVVQFNMGKRSNLN